MDTSHESRLPMTEQSEDCQSKSSLSKWGSYCQTTATWCRHNLLLILTLIGVILGVTIGLCLSRINPSDDVVMFVNFPGELFMRMMKMILIPLIVTSVIAGIGKMDSHSFGRLGRRVLLYYISTTVLATILGIILAVAIRPGDAFTSTDNLQRRSVDVSKKLDTVDAFLDILRGLFMNNLFQGTFQSQRTFYRYREINTTTWTTNVGSLIANEGLNMSGDFLERYDLERNKGLQYVYGTNALGILMFCIVFGAIMTRLGKRVQNILTLFCELNEIIFGLVHLILWYSPVGIMSLVAGKLMAIKDMETVARQLGLFIATVATGIAIHTLITFSIIYLTFTRKNPLLFLKGMSQAILTAFGTNSSAATMPATLQCLEDNLGIDKRVTRFTVPIGVTVNMDGTAIYETVAAIFIAQMSGIALDAGQIVTVCLASILASVGTAGVPGSAIVMMLMVLGSAGIPVENVGLILTIDWFMGRLQCICNILGDGYCAAIVAHLTRHDRKPIYDFPDIKDIEVNDVNQNGEIRQENGSCVETMDL